MDNEEPIKYTKCGPEGNVTLQCSLGIVERVRNTDNTDAPAGRLGTIIALWPNMAKTSVQVCWGVFMRGAPPVARKERIKYLSGYLRPPHLLTWGTVHMLLPDFSPNKGNRSISGFFLLGARERGG